MSTPSSPLGLRLDVALSDDERSALQRLADFDLGRVKARLVKDQVLPPEWVDDAIFEFRRYVGLATLHPHAALLMPSAAVDEVWHTTILFTKTYAELCRQVTGRFLHHEPLDDTNRGDAAANFPEFVQMYEAAYGPLTPIWRVQWQQEA